MKVELIARNGDRVHEGDLEELTGSSVPVRTVVAPGLGTFAYRRTFTDVDTGEKLAVYLEETGDELLG